MEIKKLRISGFKNIPDTQIADFVFFPYTIISGENYCGKSTICEAICWAFCGCNINGNVIYDYLLLNNQSKTMTVEVDFADNKGVLHTIKREKSTSGRTFLDDKETSQSALYDFIGDKEIFMNSFVVGYFQKYSPKDARELLEQVLPPILTDEILSRLPPVLTEFIPESRLLNSNAFLKENRARLKEIEKEELFLNGQLKALTDNSKETHEYDIVEDKNIRNRLDELEAERINIAKLQGSSEDMAVLLQKRELLRKEYEIMKGKLLTFSLKPGETCPACRQLITEKCVSHLKEYSEQVNSEIQKGLNEIVISGKELGRKIEELEKNRSNTHADKSLQEKLEKNEAEIKQLRQKLEDISGRNARIALMSQASGKITDLNYRLRELSEEKEYINKSVEAAVACNKIKADAQFKNISMNLDKVSIRLEKLVKSTGELKDCFELLYEGKELVLLSTSERIRAFLEISKLINTRTGLSIPVFIDNAESITHYDRPDMQIFEATVVKGEILTVKDGRFE